MIADHIRACSFLIVDGVIPGNDGRGYVLRRIIRRAIRHGYKLGQEKPFFHTLVPALAAEMGAAYPELAKGDDHVVRVLKQEEERFAETLENGMALLEGAIGKMKGKTIAGETVFKLYDTYGFPVDLTADIARERGLAIDQSGFEKAMESQRERARAASKFGVDLRAPETLDAESEFCGYERLQDEGKVARDPEGRRRGRCGCGGRRGADRPRPHAVLRRVRRPGRRRRHAHERLGAASRSRDTKKLGDAHLHVGKVEAGSFRKGETRQGDRGRRDAPGDRAQPFRYAPPARGAAQGARHARDPERARWSRPTACASISRTRSPSRPRSSRRSSGW